MPCGLSSTFFKYRFETTACKIILPLSLFLCISLSDSVSTLFSLFLSECFTLSLFISVSYWLCSSVFLSLISCLSLSHFLVLPICLSVSISLSIPLAFFLSSSFLTYHCFNILLLPISLSLFFFYSLSLSLFLLLYSFTQLQPLDFLHFLSIFLYVPVTLPHYLFCSSLFLFYNHNFCHCSSFIKSTRTYICSFILLLSFRLSHTFLFTNLPLCGSQSFSLLFWYYF